MKDLIFIVSILLNIGLGICVFFKSALNDILKEYWKNRCDRRQVRNQHIIELRKHLGSLKNSASSNLLTMAVWMQQNDPVKKAVYKGHLETSLKNSGDSFKSVKDGMIYYPDDIKTALEDFFSEYEKFGGEIVKEAMYKERLSEMFDYINTSIDRVIDMIDKKRLKLIS